MNSFKPTRAFSIAKKEVFHIVRDPFTLGLAIGLPVFLVTFFGVAIDFNLKNIDLSVVDHDKTSTSRMLTDVMSSSDYFQLHFRSRPTESLEDIESERAKGALIIKHGFEKDVGRQGGEAQLLLDGADNSTVGVVQSYMLGIQQKAISRLTASEGIPTGTVDLKTRFLYNPELNSRWFVIPGLTVVVLAILSILLTSLTVAREWENGSMELLLSTPVKPIEIIIGKLAPYLAMGFLGVIFVYLASRLGFGVPFRGSHWLFALGCLLFLGTYLSLGLFISVTVRKQQLSMQIAIMAGLLPTMLLSGFVYSIQDMPPFFQYFTMLLPARWFMTISRAIFLKGAGIVDLAPAFTALAILNVALISLAVKKFKKDVEP